MNDLLTTKELAAALKITPHTVLVWKRAGKITAEIDQHCFVRFDLAKVRKQLVKASEKKAREKFNGMVPTL